MKYFVGKWISVQSLVTLLNTTCYLENSKSYFNRCIHSNYLTDYHLYNKVIHKIQKNEENNPLKTTFYYFTRKDSHIPRYFLSTMYKWIHKIQKNEENNPLKTTFYYFTRKDSHIPRYFLSMMYKWQHIYDNFYVLRSRTSNAYDNSIHLKTNIKRK